MEDNQGVTPSGPGSRPSGGADKSSPAKPSIPNAEWPEVEWAEGYPTAEDDDFVAWDALPLDFKQAARFVLRELPKAAENCCASCTVTEAADFMGDPVTRIEFSTGGWSGAESLLGFISSRFDTRHFMESWRRGGHYVFEIEPYHLASCDTHPEGGDAKQAPLMGSAVGEAETP
jgi:hypothetical protein